MTVENKSVKLQVFDTAGQERFKSLTTGYYWEANAVILVYDVSDKPTFEST